MKINKYTPSKNSLQADNLYTTGGSTINIQYLPFETLELIKYKLNDLGFKGTKIIKERSETGQLKCIKIFTIKKVSNKIKKKLIRNLDYPTQWIDDFNEWFLAVE